MPDNAGPVTTRRRLRTELKRIREQRDMAQANVVASLDWSASKLIRIENGTVGISVTDTRALLGLYEAPADVVEDLVGLARVAKERRWWSSYRDTLSPQYQEFIGFEAEASRLRQFHPTLIPGLLQTEPYIWAVTDSMMLKPEPEALSRRLVEVRLHRQQEVLNSGAPPDFTVIIDEAALLRPVGGVDTMREQLGHLVKMAEQELVAIAVLPFSAGPHIGLLGAFHIMDFADEADDSLLYLENAQQGDVALRDKNDVLLYSRQFEKLLGMSLRGNGAIDFLHGATKRIG
jgi:transcriptional regulator with XRE-family HTH domain